MDTNLLADETTKSNKSLGENCRKFLLLFGAKTEKAIINVDEIIETIGI